LLKSKKYVYSDFGFIVFPKVIERLSKENYEHFLRENFYDRIGASTLVYRPYLYFPMDRIVPTENDTFFRHQLLHGFVHDEGSAMVGGLSGNAGLFGTVNDAAKMMQMYLNYGQYGGDRYLSESTLKDWTSRHFLQNGNRRAYGFDKPVPNNYLKNVFDSYPAPEVSDASFGHSGFTGTFAWADPKSGILYLFFSNRVYPTRENNKLTQLNLRILLQDAVYQSFNGNTYHEPEMLLAGSKASKIAQSSKSGKVSKSSSKAKKHKTRALARHGKKSNVNKSKI
jgi:CubicO group peptidase (beta-lactamase class C family)